VRSYAGHIRLYLKPHFGDIPIDRLRVSDVAAVFESIEELNDAVAEARASSGPRRAAVKWRRPVGPATCQRICATLRAAISAYMRQHSGALPANVASLLELPPGGPPRALVCTGERARAWQREFDARLAAARASGGRISPIDIWVSTPRGRHRLHALWRLIATRGLRRGEGCGLRRPDTGLAARTTCGPLADHPSSAGSSSRAPPKSDAGERRRPRRRHHRLHRQMAPRAGSGTRRRRRQGGLLVRVHHEHG
jgi:hypothetical protein